MSVVEVKRAMSPEDIADVTTLIDESTVADGRPALSDHLRLDLESGGGEGFAGLLLRGPNETTPHAYAQISDGNEAVTLEIVVHPDHQRGRQALIGELLNNALGLIAADGGGRVDWWVSEPTPSDIAIAESAGMHLDRTLLQMRRPLPAPGNVEVETRSFVPGTDENAWLAVNNRAFAGHGEQGGWTLDTLRQRQTEPWFSPNGFRVHERDGRMAAFCWTKIHPAVTDGDETLGEIYVIAVDPDFHGSGLGKQLTLAGLEYLAQQNIPTALLYVDAANVTAVTMYEQLGFKTHSTNAAFTMNVSTAKKDPSQ